MPSSEQLSLSKFAFGTASGTNLPSHDFFQYLTIRTALLSGSINHIDTGCFMRDHRAEMVAGRVLYTMFEKFGMDRSEVFVNSKHGLIGDNAYDEMYSSLIFQELIQNSALR